MIGGQAGWLARVTPRVDHGKVDSVGALYVVNRDQVTVKQEESEATGGLLTHIIN